MVYLCSSVAAASPRVTAEIIEAAAFADLAARYRVATTPVVVLDDDPANPAPLAAAALLARLAAAGPPSAVVV